MDKGNILVIDSDKATQKWLDSLLTKAGYVVQTADNGVEGLQLAARATHDLIILDLILSDTTGEQVFDSIRQNPMVGNIPFIIFSPKSDESEMERLREKGFDDFVVKRADVEFELLKSIAKVIQNPRPEIPKIKTGRLISFFSAKGGNGTSALCINIAHDIANKVAPKSVLVVDLVLPMGTLAMMTGTTGSKSIAEITAKEGDCDREILLECITFDETWNFSFISGSGTPQESQKINPDNLNIYIRRSSIYQGVCSF